MLRLIAGLPIGGVFDGVIENARPVALMAQDPGLLSWLNVRENIALGARLRAQAVDRDRLDGILDRTGLTPFALHRPHALSGGQRQRVALARTLMEERELVLLDEPFSALDVRMRLMMQDLSAGLLRGRTVLMVTHDPAEASRISDHIVVLTETGLTEIAVAKSHTPRAPTDPDNMALQAHLLTLLTTQENAP